MSASASAPMAKPTSLQIRLGIAARAAMPGGRCIAAQNAASEGDWWGRVHGATIRAVADCLLCISLES